MIMTENPDLCTLAIGDSPINIGMIKEANVGISIYNAKRKLMKNISHYTVT